MKKAEYVQKMMNILQDGSKFKEPGDSASHDNTIRNEKSLQSLLQSLTQNGEISQEVYQRIRPTGSVRPRMYGLP